MIDFEVFFENINDLIDEHRKLTIFICGLLIFMTLCALMVLTFKDFAPKKKQNIDSGQKKLVLDQPLLIPPGPIVSSEYIISRKKTSKWKKEEIEKWFTYPGNSELKDLRSANDRIITEIIGNAP